MESENEISDSDLATDQEILVVETNTLPETNIQNNKTAASEIGLIVISSISLFILFYVIFLFSRLSRSFEYLKSDIENAFKEKSEVVVLKKNSEEDLVNMKSNFVSFTKQLQEYLNKTMTSVKEDTKKTSDLLESLNSIVIEKDKELERFKKGYDLVRMRSFVMNIIEALSFLQNRKSEFTDQKFSSYVSAYEKQLLRILDDLSINSYSPRKGTPVADIEGIEVIDSIESSEEGKQNCVAEVINDGFVMNYQDGRNEILKAAQVKVFR